MTLIAVLEELADLAPERVMAVGYTTCRVILNDRLVYLDLDNPLDSLPQLEMALREECEARGWDWALYRSGDEFRAALYRRPGQDSTEVEDLLWSAQAPAEALAGCVLAALKAERGEG